MELEIKVVNLSDIKPNPENPRKISKAALDRLVKSIQDFPEMMHLREIVVDETMTVLGGNMRRKALLKAGIKECTAKIVTGLTPEQKREFVIKDNGQMGEWDLDVLAKSWCNLPLAEWGVELPEDWTADNGEPTEDDFDSDAAADEISEPISKTGDVWMLGKHRLMCGDSTSENDVNRLMVGRRADMVFTDPPYGVGYCGGLKKRERLAGDEVGTEIYAKALPALRVHAADHAALYLWYADAHAAAAAAAAAGYKITAQIIWVKNNAQYMTSAHYKGKHEPCYYAYKKGKQAKWYGPNNEITVWDENRANKNEYHPTQKPVGLAARATKNSTKKGDIILDLFCGSGSTLIAAEQLGRICYGMEISPVYCDVIVKRWETLTGKKAVIEKNERP